MSTGDARTPLTRERILETALALLDERGLEALTMRRLGAALGVEAMSLYKHVPSKEAILDGVRNLLIAEFAERLPPGPAGHWRDDLAAMARTYRAVGRDHPVAFGLIASGPGRAYVAGSALAEDAIARLVEAGLDRRTAILAGRTILRFVLASGLLEEADEDAPPPITPEALDQLAGDRPLVADLIRTMGPATDDVLFEFGLDLLLTGIEARLPGA